MIPTTRYRLVACSDGPMSERDIQTAIFACELWDQVGKCAAALEAALKGAGDAWQPIESAPKDGSEIIIGSPDGGVFAGFWSEVPNYWGKLGWFGESDRAGCDATRKPFQPTHWQPLPAPPSAKGEV